MNNLCVYQVGAVARQRIRSRRAANSASGTATSAIWKIVLREWETILAPIFMSLSWMLVSDQGRNRARMVALEEAYGEYKLIDEKNRIL